MPVNSISSSLSLQNSQLNKKTDELTERKPLIENKPVNAKEDDKAQIKNREVANLERAQKSQEPAKAVVNTSGQAVGTRINTSA